jgi:peptide chain release factor 3
MSKNLKQEIDKRRTFAIISHPDAGKTTITEKFLLYGGAIREAGSVRARKASRHATSDWMEIEKQRGISVTSSAMQFNYEGYTINILDTPGHQDFSEDTYRTLVAADAAVMLIDGAKGVEPQTIKLFQVCRLRKIPIFTFVNKMDRASRNPFDLMDEIEKVLGIRAIPFNWPIGIFGDFKGVYNRRNQTVERFDPTEQDHGASKVQVSVKSIDDPELDSLIGTSYREDLQDDIELLDIAGDDFDMDLVLRGELTPMFFGSAITNFGVETFLQAFLKMAPPPSGRNSDHGMVNPYDDVFRGFIFKIQANMNPGHRDRLAFLRIVSGAFEKDMTVINSRTGKPVKLQQPQQFMAQEHKSVDRAFAGDIIGLFDPGIFRLGDSLCEAEAPVSFDSIPTFAPEHFARIQAKDSLKRKQFLKGMEQLAQEGTIQMYKEFDIGTETFVVGVVGVLQFDVLEQRLKDEYKVEILKTNLPYRFARWIEVTDPAKAPDLDSLNLTSTSLLVHDHYGDPVLLAESDWALDWALEKNKGIGLLEINDRH